MNIETDRGIKMEEIKLSIQEENKLVSNAKLYILIVLFVGTIGMALPNEIKAFVGFVGIVLAFMAYNPLKKLGLSRKGLILYIATEALALLLVILLIVAVLIDSMALVGLLAGLSLVLVVVKIMSIVFLIKTYIQLRNNYPKER